MTRVTTLCVLMLAICGISTAEPPTEANWSEHISRYVGTFHLMADDADEASFQFHSKWAEKDKVLEYSNRSIGDGPMSWSSGFCFWNAEEKRIEFNEIEYGDEGRIAAEGFCVNASKTTMTWIVTFWTHEGVVRRMAMADTFTKDGLDRSITILDGKPLPAEIIKWVRVKK